MRPPEDPPEDGDPAPGTTPPAPPTYPPVMRPTAPSSSPAGWAAPRPPAPPEPSAPAGPPASEAPTGVLAGAAATPTRAERESVPAPDAEAAPGPDDAEARSRRTRGLVLTIVGVVVIVVAAWPLLKGDGGDEGARTIDGAAQSDSDPKLDAGDATADPDRQPDDGTASSDDPGDASDDPGAASDDRTTTTDPTSPKAGVAQGDVVDLGDWRIRVAGASTMMDVVAVKVSVSWAGSGTGDPSELGFTITSGGTSYAPGAPGCPIGSESIPYQQIGEQPIEAGLCFLVPEVDLSTTTLLAEAVSAPSVDAALRLS